MRRATTTMTSLVTIGGIAFAIMQMVRTRRPTGWNRATHWMSQMLNQMTRGTNQMMNGSNGMMRAVRRRVRG